MNTVDPASTHGPLAGHKVLVVDDDPLILLSITGPLTRMGCEVLATTSLMEGLRLSARHDLDLAILGITLSTDPVYPLADMIQSRGIRLLFVTALLGVEIRPEWRAVPRLSKPLDMNLFARVIRALLPD